MRQLVAKNYIVLKNLLYDSHSSLEENILLIRNYKTSTAAHKRLEKIIKRRCERVMKIDYGLKVLPDTILRIANIEEFQWLLQPELKAIKDGLKYVEDDDNYYGDEYCTYRGYINAKGQRQGVGIVID
jgi:hypothetical protein